MAPNPYAPPAAPVSEVQPQRPPLERPAAVARACTLLWFSFGLSILGMIVKSISRTTGAQFVGALVGLLVGGILGLLITRWFTSKLELGRNWMRLFMTITNAIAYLSVLAFWPFYRQLFQTAYAGRPIQVAIMCVQVVIGLTVIVLINTPKTRAWFQSMSKP
jgi:hypothetical protein